MIAALALALSLGGVQGELPVRLRNDGWTLAGTLRRPDNLGPVPAVLLLNGAARDQRAYLGLARELAARGVASLRLDLRGEGGSVNRGRFEPGRSDPALNGAERDVAVALRWLGRQPGIDGARLGALGASYSGEAMAIAGRMGTRAAAYVALSPGSLSDTTIGQIDSIGRPWWLIASRQERFAGRVVERIPVVSRTARVTMVEGTSHASDLLSPHNNLEAEIADWFAARLRGIGAPELWGGLDPGGHPVGFRRLRIAGTGEPLLIDVWYPAASIGPPLRLGDYLALADDLRGLVPGSRPATLSATMTGDSAALPSALTDRVLSAPMAAGRDLPFATNRFPLVLWAPRYGTTVAQSVLCEWLASHGFVVAFPRPERGGKLPFELPTAEAKRVELESRVNDMTRAVDTLSRIASVEPRSIGVIAWSYTGEMATAYQQREPRVELVVGLSTNLLSDWIFRPDRRPERETDSLEAAYAIITQSDSSSRRPPAMARVAGASYYVELPGLRHGSFNALEGYLPSLLGVTTVQPWSASGPRGVTGYQTAATMVLRLLRQHVVARNRAPLTALVLMSGLEFGSGVVQ